MLTQRAWLTRHFWKGQPDVRAKAELGRILLCCCYGEREERTWTSVLASLTAVYPGFCQLASGDSPTAVTPEHALHSAHKVSSVLEHMSSVLGDAGLMQMLSSLRYVGRAILCGPSKGRDQVSGLSNEVASQRQGQGRFPQKIGEGMRSLAHHSTSQASWLESLRGPSSFCSHVAIEVLN